MSGHTVRGWGWRGAILALALVLLAGGSAWAQVSNAQIEIRVVDNEALALPGVSVRATNVDTGFERMAISEADGTAKLAALPPGTYKLLVELDGFNPVEQVGIVLRVGQTLRINATMSPRAAERAEVVVTGSVPLVDVVKVDSSTNVVPEQIESLPVPDRNFENLAFITPGVQRERGGFRFIQGGPVIGAGGNASQSTIMVNGVDFTDQALGLSRQRFSQDAVREFKVIANRFDSEMGGSAGGALSIITRSGTNTLAGSVFAYYRADGLRAKGALEKENLDYSRGQYGFTLGGPVVKDKLHYFLSGEYIDIDDLVLFRPGGAFASQAKDVNVPTKQTLLFGSLDYTINESSRFAARGTYERFRQKNFRVGGVSDESWGLQLNRDNWNVSFEHTYLPSERFLNELRGQFGSRKYDEPTNSSAREEWFSLGNTLKTGMNTTGNLLGDGDQWELRDTAHFYLSKHDLKAGLSVQGIRETSRIDTFESGLFLWLNDTRSFLVSYAYGVGSSEVEKKTTLYGVFLQDDWRPVSGLTVNLGLRYDLDTDGNNPDFRHTLRPHGRDRDTDNYQPRFGFSWDVTGKGEHLVRGGWGRFTGRYLLVPSFIELQQNGETGRKLFTRVNGLLYGLPMFYLDPNNPNSTGLLLKPQIALLDTKLEAPQADQATLGWTWRLGNSGLYFDTEAIYVKGEKEIIVRDTNWSAANARINTNYDQINTYTNEGHSKYKALVMSLNGTIKGGHLLTASLTLAEKRNIMDDFSPEFPYGYPSVPSNIENEYGRGRGDERWRMVVSGVFRLPWDITVAPVAEYGTGQPWNRRLGYDFNGDGKASDRFPWVKRNNQSGPPFRQMNLRIAKGFKLADAGRLEILAEGFNIFNTVNYDVNSVQQGEFLSGPTVANPTAPYVKNPMFGKYTSTFKGREIQLGLRFLF
ncbi:MAG: TonB-dependent receptor [Thermoanaerobaculaceae bacterium]|nr:TonB-dependent receptor [Thermoanaerobaculaceae bacterium]MDI9622634.1 TonB-dependent receptor [Acidobacteriota bacterium]NLH11666.1 TonB-dependent receptor [Holophagae bacterium]HPW54617.1 TonB-dependent receptor [Thermoanaerobaculaceae bacterium]